MDVDDEDMELDQDCRHRAAEKLSGRFVSGAGAPDADSMSCDTARVVLKRLAELCCGNKINTNNAFDLQGIDALRVSSR
jgi:hypothetical protein